MFQGIAGTPYASQERLEGIVLRSNLSLPVASDNRDALEDIHPDAGDIAKEEERKDTSGNTEAAQNGTVSESARGVNAMEVGGCVELGRNGRRAANGRSESL